MGFVAAASAVALTVALFRTIGPRRTRLVAQVAAAVIGAAFVIGLQITAIFSSGTISQAAILQVAEFLSYAPAIDSLFWWPARAALGDTRPLLAILCVGLIVLALAVMVFSKRFGEHVVAASGAVFAPRRQPQAASFRGGSPSRALRQKEWMLLRRDPWLVSQTLMQLLYLLPPALLMWKSFAGDRGALVLLVPVLVMAAGQLAGGLAWLAISGEDAPDLVRTAPVPARAVIRAKVEAVMGVIAIVFAPFLLPLVLATPLFAAVAAAGIIAAAPSAIAIQLWFRTQARRSQFRRRQTSSRMATFAEAFSSITWAATAALAAAGLWQAVVTGVIAVVVLFAARLTAPRVET
jgi:ABC-2 type transport system permease protein